MPDARLDDVSAAEVAGDLLRLGRATPRSPAACPGTAVRRGRGRAAGGRVGALASGLAGLRGHGAPVGGAAVVPSRCGRVERARPRIALRRATVSHRHGQGGERDPRARRHPDNVDAIVRVPRSGRVVHKGSSGDRGPSRPPRPRPVSGGRRRSTPSAPSRVVGQSGRPVAARRSGVAEPAERGDRVAVGPGVEDPRRLEARRVVLHPGAAQQDDGVGGQPPWHVGRLVDHDACRSCAPRRWSAGGPPGGRAARRPARRGLGEPDRPAGRPSGCRSRPDVVGVRSPARRRSPPRPRAAAAARRHVPGVPDPRDRDRRPWCCRSRGPGRRPRRRCPGRPATGRPGRRPGRAPAAGRPPGRLLGGDPRGDHPGGDAARPGVVRGRRGRGPAAAGWPGRAPRRGAVERADAGRCLAIGPAAGRRGAPPTTRRRRRRPGWWERRCWDRAHDRHAGQQGAWKSAARRRRARPRRVSGSPRALRGGGYQGGMPQCLSGLAGRPPGL